jgi:hypothetical protein
MRQAPEFDEFGIVEHFDISYTLESFEPFEGLQFAVHGDSQHARDFLQTGERVQIGGPATHGINQEITFDCADSTKGVHLLLCLHERLFGNHDSRARSITRVARLVARSYVRGARIDDSLRTSVSMLGTNIVLLRRRCAASVGRLRFCLARVRGPLARGNGRLCGPRIACRVKQAHRLRVARIRSRVLHDCIDRARAVQTVHGLRAGCSQRTHGGHGKNGFEARIPHPR